MTILLQFRCLVLGALKETKNETTTRNGICQRMRHSGRPTTTVSEANERPPFRLRLRLRLCFHISVPSISTSLFAYTVGICLLRHFLMCVRTSFCGSLSCLATASGTGIGIRIRFAERVQFYFGDVTNAISVSHMCKNVFRFMRAQPTRCVSCPVAIRHTYTPQSSAEGAHRNAA